MAKKMLFILLIQGISLSLFAQQQRSFQFQIHSTLLFTGEWTATYDFFMGSNAKYFPKTRSTARPYLCAGVQTNLGPTTARVWLLDLSAGVQYPFSRSSRNRWLLDANVGLLYGQEQLALPLEQPQAFQHQIIGFTGKLGLTYQLSNQIKLSTYLQQWHTNATGVGLAASLSF